MNGRSTGAGASRFATGACVRRDASGSAAVVVLTAGARSVPLQSHRPPTTTTKTAAIPALIVRSRRLAAAIATGSGATGTARQRGHLVIVTRNFAPQFAQTIA